jgi:hypothetical protein
MGEGKTETEARRKAEAESYRMFTAKNKYVEFSETTYKEIEESGLKATLPEYATNYTFVCNPKPEKINDIHCKVYILYAWRRDFNKSVNFGEVDTKVCDESNEQLDYVELQDDGIAVQKNNITSTELGYEEAKLLCEGSTLSGYTDWRLPTIQELSAIFSNRNKFDKYLFYIDYRPNAVYPPSVYWSSSKKNESPEKTKSSKKKNVYTERPVYMLMRMTDGLLLYSNDFFTTSNYCRCVRTLP